MTTSALRRRDRNRLLAVLVIALVIVALVALMLGIGFPSGAPAASGDRPTATSATATPTPAPSAKYRTAQRQLAALPVRQAATTVPYEREVDFGSPWQDVDDNGCDTRNDILARDLVRITLSGTCTVLTGTLHDPYTGATIDFVRGVGTSTAVQIDHVVALKDAWETGAQALSAEERVALANDPLNLMAADGPANASKGASDASDWLPVSTYRCEYVARQVSVKVKYELWVTSAELAAIESVLTGC